MDVMETHLSTAMARIVPTTITEKYRENAMLMLRQRGDSMDIYKSLMDSIVYV